MTQSAVRFGLPVYLLLCLILGGSGQGVWGKFALQILALVLLLILAISADTGEARRGILGKLPLIGLAFLVIVLFELLPLPPTVWAVLPGRALVAEGFNLLQQTKPWLSWSLVPSDSIAALFPLLVPLAVLALLIQHRTAPPYLLIGALVFGTLSGVVLGFFQVRSGSYYLYQYSAFGQAAGFFANSNHMGSLLLVNIPFVAAVSADQYQRRTDLSQRGLVIGIGLGFSFILMIAIALNHSLAVIMLGGPVILLSLAIPQWPHSRVRKALAGFALLALVTVVSIGALGGRFNMATKESSIQTRSEIWSTTRAAVSDFGFSGSGLGTFEKVYRRYENPETVDATFVNHAHNDYLELALELGLPGLVLIAMFLWWWGRRVRRAWQSKGSVYARAASIASAAILVHSLVDFPLRTAAISAVFAMCLGLMVVRFAPLRTDGRKDLWESRHLAID